MFKMFFVCFLFAISFFANNAQAYSAQNINILNDTTISAKEEVFEIYDAKNENAVLAPNSTKKLQALNKKTPYNPFLLSQNILVLKKGSIFYYSSGQNNFPPASYSVKTNDIRAP